jgi:hypothetical protein
MTIALSRHPVALAVICVGLLVAACATAPIQQQNTDRLSALHTGTPLPSFRDLFPDAYIGGLSGNLQAWVLRGHRYSPGTKGANPWSGNVTEYLHFYFQSDTLIQWGAPGDWEQAFNITIRHN